MHVFFTILGGGGGGGRGVTVSSLLTSTFQLARLKAHFMISPIYEQRNKQNNSGHICFMNLIVLYCN